LEERVTTGKSLTFNISAEVDAICTLVPEGFLPTVTGELKPGTTYTVEQKFQYGCNSPYRLDVQATFGRMVNVSAAASGQNIGLDYALTFGGKEIQLDMMRSAQLAEVRTYQSLLPLRATTGTFAISVPDAKNVVAGRYQEKFILTLSSIL